MYRISLGVFRKSNIATSLLIPILAISILTISVPLTTTQSMTTNFVKISPTLMNKIATYGDASVNILIETYTSDYSSVTMDINSLRGKVGYEYKYVNALSASIPANKIAQLAENENIVKICYDEERSLSSGYGGSPIGIETAGDMDSLLTSPTIMQAKKYQTVSITPKQLASSEPSNYWNPTAMGAEEIWEETNYGEGSLVVIIDTGIWTGHFMFAGTDIVGGIDMSYDVGDPTHEGWDNPNNDAHGGHVAGIIASTGGIIVSATDPLAQAIERYSGTILPPSDPYGYPGGKVIWLLGMAPAASLYIIKVFDHTGLGVPTSMVIAGMEHALDLKRVEGFDVDIISMSLGGPTVFDGRDLEDQLVDTITENGIALVTSAGNAGPASMTTGSPGSANTAITVGAAATPVQTRVFWEWYYFGRFGIPFTGIGYPLFTSEVPQIHALSSRGPTSDGRSKPTLSATGIFVLSAYITGGVQDIAWFSGTSMACPAVSGAVALVNAFAETARGRWKKLRAASPEDYKQALMNGAVWLEGYTERDQGAGYLNAANALEALKADKSIGDTAPPLPPTGELIDITNVPIVGEGTFAASVTDLPPGHKVEFIFEVTQATSWVKLDVTNVDLGTYNPLGINSFEAYIQSAKRTMYAYYVDSANIWGKAWFRITDDRTKWSGAVTGVFWDDYTRVIEPGYMKVVIENDWTSADMLSGDIKISVKAEVEVPDFSDSGTIGQDEMLVYGFYGLPLGVTKVDLELWWENDWTKYPTSDLDLYIWWYDGVDFHFAGYATATLNSPEAITIKEKTMVGLWIQIYGYAIYTPTETDSWELRIFHK